MFKVYKSQWKSWGKKGDMVLRKEVQSILRVKLWNKIDDQKDSSLVARTMVANGTPVWSASTAREIVFWVIVNSWQ